jgi:hypothetical protein
MDFFTFDYEGRAFRIPGFQPALLKSFVNMAYKAIETPQKLIGYDDKWKWNWENVMDVYRPGWRKLSYKESPTLAAIGTFLTGRDVMGERVEGLDKVWEVLSMLIPISGEAYLTERDLPFSPAASAATFFGFPERPLAASENLTAAGNEFVKTMDPTLLPAELWAKQEEGTLTWKDLGTLQRLVLSQNPDLAALKDLADIERMSTETDQWRRWRLGNENLQTEQTTWTATAVDWLKNGNPSGEPFGMKDYNSRKRVKASEWAGARHQLETDNPEIYALFAKWKLEGQDVQASFTAAYNEYYDTVYGEDTYDDLDGVNWTVREDKTKQWIARWGQDYYDILQEVIKIGFKDDDPLIGFMWEADRALESYWAIPEEDRLDYRRNPVNVDIEAALIFRGFTSTIENPNAEGIVREWCAEYGIDPDKVIPALTKLLIPDIMLQKFDGLQPNDLREFNELPIAGYARDRFIVEHPAFKAFVTSTEVVDGQKIGFLNGFNEAGEDLYTWDKVATVQEEELINLYYGLPNQTRTKQMWRCQYPAGDAALFRLHKVSARMDPDVCRGFTTTTSTQAAAGLGQ